MEPCHVAQKSSMVCVLNLAWQLDLRWIRTSHRWHQSSHLGDATQSARCERSSSATTAAATQNHYWAILGRDFSKRSQCYQSGIQIGVNSKSQSYIEQDNIVAMVVHRSVDPDGQLLLIGYDPFENVHVMISTEPLSWSPLEMLLGWKANTRSIASIRSAANASWITVVSASSPF